MLSFRQSEVPVLTVTGNCGIIALIKSGRVICTRCGRPTPQRVLPDTEFHNLPVFCKNCRTVQICSYVPVPLCQRQDP